MKKEREYVCVFSPACLPLPQFPCTAASLHCTAHSHIFGGCTNWDHGYAGMGLSKSYFQNDRPGSAGLDNASIDMFHDLNDRTGINSTYLKQRW